MALPVVLLLLLVGGGLHSLPPSPHHHDGAQQDAPPPSRSCEFAVLGAGAGGTYAAWRLATSNAAGAPKPDQICVFERLPHVGGRTYTLHDQGPRKDLQVDLGATVFCDRLPNLQNGHSYCNGMETPLMKTVIQTALKLPTVEYRDNPAPHCHVVANVNETEAKCTKLPGGSWDPDTRQCTDCTPDRDYFGCHKIVKEVGGRENAGFATYIEGMANESAALGVRFLFGHHLEELVAAPPPAAADPAGTAASPPPPMTLRFKNGAVVKATSVLLNLPVLPMNQLMRNSPTLRPHMEKAPHQGAFLRVPHGWRLFKLLLHYDWAWWRTLGLLDGPFQIHPTPPNDDGSADACPLCSPSQELPLAGRYHDGEAFPMISGI